MNHRIVFDTDIATDVDDVLALAVLLGSPEIDLIGVTTVHADVVTRAMFVEKMLGLRGVRGVPICLGASHQLVGREEPYWEGHEGRHFLTGDESAPGVDQRSSAQFLIDTVLAAPGDVTVLAVGPLTNVAIAMLHEPRFAESLGRLMIMGGSIDTARVGVVAEHNIKLDPEAAAIVFRSGAAIELVTLDVTQQVTIGLEGTETIRRGGTAYHESISTQVTAYPAFERRGYRTFLHDPLAALAILDPSMITWESMSVDVELDGRLTRGMTVARRQESGTCRVARAVDADAAHDEIVRRIAS
jgi:purine nucleosidase